MRWGLEVKDRKWKHKTYLMCFLGCDAVDWVVKTLNLENREYGTLFCQTLMDRSIFHHVTFDDTFLDSSIPFRFVQDDKKYVHVTSLTRTIAVQRANGALEKIELPPELEMGGKEKKR